MLSIKVLGPGCSRCLQLERTVRRVVETVGMAANVEKITDMQEIMAYGLLSTPGLVVNGRLVSAGRVPSESDIAKWLQQP